MSILQLEVWQRGPIEEIPALLQPVAHALLQAREELNLAMNGFSDDLLWQRPANIASVAFHLQHLSGVLDRVFTYSLSLSLSARQLKELEAESLLHQPNLTTAILLNRFNMQVDKSIVQLKNTDVNTLTEFRGIGRKMLPSTVIGLLFHGAEHTMRHLGQLLVTIKVLAKPVNEE